MNIKKIKKIIWQACISRNFFKLLDFFSDLTIAEKIFYFIFIRPFYKERFFFEGNIRITGQLNRIERRTMYNTILEYKPKNFFEIGTWKGGGSTFFVAHAFNKLNNGMVYTSEIDEKFYQQAMKSYKKHAPELLSRITFLLSGNLVDFIPFLEKETSADCVFLDGSNNPQETVEQLKFFSSYMTTGAILMLHDWHSEKMTALRPLLLNSPDWILKTEIGQPLSKYGFAIFVKK